MPTVFIALSNSSNNPLPFIDNEFAGLKDIYSNKNIKVKSDIIRFESPLDLLKKINKHQHKILIFQFSGHAGNDFLLIEDSSFKKDTFLNAKGIHGILSNCSILKIVILNGCSTSPQVRQLLKLDIDIVIATQSDINDEAAAYFSVGFHNELAINKKTIKESFEQGIHFAKTINPDIKSRYNFCRGIDIYDKNTIEQDEWGIYFKNEIDLDWKLPYENIDEYKYLVKIQSSSSHQKLDHYIRIHDFNYHLLKYPNNETKTMLKRLYKRELTKAITDTKWLLNDKYNPRKIQEKIVLFETCISLNMKFGIENDANNIEFNNLKHDFKLWLELLNGRISSNEFSKQQKSGILKHREEEKDNDSHFFTILLIILLIGFIVLFIFFFDIIDYFFTSQI